jgi:hypothetical protein
MRWDELFADLSGQGEAEQAAELAAEVAERGRWESGQITLLDRLRSMPVGSPVLLGLADSDSARGSLLAVGVDWVVLGEARRDCLVPHTALRWVRRTEPESADQAAALSGYAGTCGELPAVPRLRLAQAVRALVRDRAYVRVRLLDGETLSGTVDRAGPDHLDLAQHPADVARRNADVQATWLVPYAAVTSVRGGQVWSAP